MKLFEFNGDFPYWAVICARSNYEALGFYLCTVSSIDEDACGELPDEIISDNLFETIKAKCMDNYTLEDFNRDINNTEPSLILIDTSL